MKKVILILAVSFISFIASAQKKKISIVSIEKIGTEKEVSTDFAIDYSKVCKKALKKGYKLFSSEKEFVLKNKFPQNSTGLFVIATKPVLKKHSGVYLYYIDEHGKIVWNYEINLAVEKQGTSHYGDGADTFHGAKFIFIAP